MNIAKYLADDMQWHAKKLGQLVVVKCLALDLGIDAESGFVEIPAKENEAIVFHIFAHDLVTDVPRLLPLVVRFEKEADAEGPMLVGTGLRARFELHLHPIPSQRTLARDWPDTTLLAEAVGRG